MPRDSRASAATLLAKVSAGASLNSEFGPAQESLAPNDRAFFREMVYGSLRWWPFYHGICRQLLQKPMKRKDGDIEALLIIGLYELDHSETPDYASVSSAVDAAKKLQKPWAKGLINGCLRRYQRDREALQQQLSHAEAAGLPDWLYETVVNEWPDCWKAIVESAQNRPPMSLRINQQQVTLRDYCERLEAAAIPIGRIHKFGVTLHKACNVDELPGFFDGLCSVQDESAQWAAACLAREAGERILDACAAPGGKACHLAEMGYSVLAMDISEQRLEKVASNRDRLRLTMDIQVGDARSAKASSEEFDGILLDVPCSATGVMRRNPDVKLIRTNDDIDKFSALQQELISTVWPRLKPGGRLLYATCSILRRENDDVVERFLAETPNASIEALTQLPGCPMKFGHQLLPKSDGGDGLYYALIRKT